MARPLPQSATDTRSEVNVFAPQVLTLWDLALLERHLAFYEALAGGRRQPTSALQAHFVAVALGHAAPSTQHEIAYRRHREGWLAPGSPGTAHVGPTIVKPTGRVERTVDWTDDARLAGTASSVSETLDRVQQLYKSGRAKAQRASADAAAWMATVLSDVELGRSLADWTSAEFGRLSDVYTGAMDGAFRGGLVGGGGYVSPWLHRLFEGHELLDAWRAVRGALPDDGLGEEFVAYLRALGSDLATQIGLPLASLSPDQFEALKAVLCDQLGVSREWLIDALHYNAVEVAAAAIPLAAAAMGWTVREAEEFARLAGSLGIGAAVAANPLMALVAVALLAKAFHGARHEPTLVRSALTGAATSGVVLGTSALIGGPVWLGLFAGIGVATGIRQAVRSRGTVGSRARHLPSGEALAETLQRFWDTRFRRSGLA
jgi:hypothetical protein